MILIETAVPTPLSRNFIYEAPTALAAGVRVEVPFGKQKKIAVVLRTLGADEKLPDVKLRSIIAVVDAAPVYSSVLLELAQWLSQYYMHPVGEVLKAMLPAGPTSGKARKKTEQHVEITEEKEKPQLSPLPALTAEQTAAVEKIIAAGHPKKPVLLHGVTGSGKTEVYLRLIANLLENSAAEQALVMVPEIALTPQFTRIFAARFPGQVAVVHSAMTPARRRDELERIRSGAAAILVGPRSAVFAPFANLKLVIVDEEHDPSYKQQSGFSYHGRDTAILRAKLEGAGIVLGSATPSLETYWNATQGKYELCTLAKRVTGAALPEMELVAATGLRSQFFLPSMGNGSAPFEDILAAGVEQVGSTPPFSPEVIAALQANLAAGHQALVIVPRRGFSSYLLDLASRSPLLCPDCSISLTLHKPSVQLKCHYCDFSQPLSAVYGQNSSRKLLAAGLGSQKVELFLKKLVPGVRVVRVDSDIAAKKDHLPQTLSAFRERKIDILVGTQMLAKGHDFPHVALTVILDADHLLDLPDVRAGERTFQLIVQSAGRAGRGEIPGKVFIQTARASHPVVQSGIHHDFISFANRELEFRRTFRYPPFGRMAVIEITSPDSAELTEFCAPMEQALAMLAQQSPGVIRAMGPSVPPLEKVRSRYRRMVLVIWDNPRGLQNFVAGFLEKFKRRPRSLRLNIDVDPQSLL